MWAYIMFLARVFPLGPIRVSQRQRRKKKKKKKTHKKGQSIILFIGKANFDQPNTTLLPKHSLVCTCCSLRPSSVNFYRFHLKHIISFPRQCLGTLKVSKGVNTHFLSVFLFSFFFFFSRGMGLKYSMCKKIVVVFESWADNVKITAVKKSLFLLILFR